MSHVSLIKDSFATQQEFCGAISIMMIYIPNFLTVPHKTIKIVSS